MINTHTHAHLFSSFINAVADALTIGLHAFLFLIDEVRILSDRESVISGSEDRTSRLSSNKHGRDSSAARLVSGGGGTRGIGTPVIGIHLGSTTVARVGSLTVGKGSVGVGVRGTRNCLASVKLEINCCSLKVGVRSCKKVVKYMSQN